MAPLASFKDFATQFVKVAFPPTSMGKVATAIGFDTRPISLRAMMATAAPYVPDLSWLSFVDNSQKNTPPGWQVIFLWTDDANLPPWDYDSGAWSGPPPNTARAATSWQFTVWPPGGSPVIDATVPVANENTVGGVQYIYSGELVGNFDYQITAYNNYGSSTTGKQAVTIALGNSVSAPTGGLKGQFNYIFSNNCKPLTDINVTINVTEDIAYQTSSATKGFSFQFNAISQTNAKINVQQFVIDFSGNELQWVINLFSGTGQLTSPKGAGAGNLAMLSSSKVPAGYQLKISPQSDSKGNISGATFVVIDDHGKVLANSTESLTSLADPVPSADLSPIVAFEFNLVGPGDKQSVVLSSGSGSIVYEAKGGLAVTNSWPCGSEGGTLENANSNYGGLTSGPGSIFSQSFGIST
jgi:hypothetical protein